MKKMVLLSAVLVAMVTLLGQPVQGQQEETELDHVPEESVPVFPKFTNRDFRLIKQLVRKLIDDNKEDGVTTFNAGFLRMTFHDCWGGCDGCIDFDNGGNAGIQKFFGPLFELWNTGKIGRHDINKKMSFADLVSVAGIVAIDYATTFQEGCDDGSCFPKIPFKVGRVDCPNRESPPNRKSFFFPGPHNHNAPKLGAEFNLTMEEHTAILGAHTIGKMTKKNSAFDGQWTHDNHVFNNQYYKNLMNATLGYHQEKNAAGHMFWATNETPVMMLGDDASLAHKIIVRPKSKGVAECNLFEEVDGKEVCGASEERVLVQKFAHNNRAFYKAFASAMRKVIDNTKGVELYKIGEEPPASRNVIPHRPESSSTNEKVETGQSKNQNEGRLTKEERQKRREERQRRRQAKTSEGTTTTTTKATTTTTAAPATVPRRFQIPRIFNPFGHGMTLHLRQKRALENGANLYSQLRVKRMASKKKSKSHKTNLRKLPKNFYRKMTTPDVTYTPTTTAYTTTDSAHHKAKDVTYTPTTTDYSTTSEPYTSTTDSAHHKAKDVTYTPTTTDYSTTSEPYTSTTDSAHHKAKDVTYTPTTTDYSTTTEPYASTSTDYTSSTTDYMTTTGYTTTEDYTTTTDYSTTTDYTTSPYTTAIRKPSTAAGHKHGTVLLQRNKRSADNLLQSSIRTIGKKFLKNGKPKFVKKTTKAPITYTPTTDYSSTTEPYTSTTDSAHHKADDVTYTPTTTDYASTTTDYSSTTDYSTTSEYPSTTDYSTTSDYPSTTSPYESTTSDYTTTTTPYTSTTDTAHHIGKKRKPAPAEITYTPTSSSTTSSTTTPYFSTVNPTPAPAPGPAPSSGHASGTVLVSRMKRSVMNEDMHSINKRALKRKIGHVKVKTRRTHHKVKEDVTYTPSEYSTSTPYSSSTTTDYTTTPDYTTTTDYTTTSDYTTTTDYSTTSEPYTTTTTMYSTTDIEHHIGKKGKHIPDEVTYTPSSSSTSTTTPYTTAMRHTSAPSSGSGHIHGSILLERQK